MKALSIEQMESIEAGCDTTGLILAGASIVLGTAGLLTGPVGWATLSVFAASRVVSIASVLNACDVI